MRITIKRTKKRIPDRQKATTLQKSIDLMEEGARHFVREVARNVNVDTGMTIGGLMPVSRFLKIVDAGAVPSGSRKGAMLGWNRATWDKTKIKGPGLGASLSERGKAWDFVAGSPNRFSVTFWFKPQVFQHKLNDAGLGAQAPWDSVRKGQLAMLEFIKNNGTTAIPRFKDWLKFG